MPFTRNLIEYVKGDIDPDIEILLGGDDEEANLVKFDMPEKLKED